MERRNPFPTDIETQSDGGATTEPAAILPPPPSSASRNRAWEKAQRSDGYCHVGYRHVPVHIRDRLNAIAHNFFIPANEVGRLFLEHALQQYDAGLIQVEPVLYAGKLTLFPPKRKEGREK